MKRKQVNRNTERKKKLLIVVDLVLIKLLSEFFSDLLG